MQARESRFMRWKFNSSFFYASDPIVARIRCCWTLRHAKPGMPAHPGLVACIRIDALRMRNGTHAARAGTLLRGAGGLVGQARRLSGGHFIARAVVAAL
jgi:hypothetical protein